jgi:hypothetical protein
MRIIAIFHDDRCVHRVNIGLDVHSVNVVGNRLVMGSERRVTASDDDKQRLDSPITSWRDRAAWRCVAITAVLDAAASGGSWGSFGSPERR